MKFKECGPSFGSSQFIDFKVSFLRWCFVIRAKAIAIAAPIVARRSRIAGLVDATLDLAAPQRVDRSWARDHVGYTLAIGANQSAERVHVGIATYYFKERIQMRKDSCVKRRKLTDEWRKKQKSDKPGGIWRARARSMSSAWRPSKRAGVTASSYLIERKERIDVAHK